MSRRRLHPDERSLWKDVTRSIAPLPKRRADDADDAEPPRAAAQARRKTQSPPKTSPSRCPLRLAPRRAPPRPEPAPLGRKAKRRLARGADAIDGRLDLHGMTQAQAHDALLGFLRRARRGRQGGAGDHRQGRRRVVERARRAQAPGADVAAAAGVSRTRRRLREPPASATAARARCTCGCEVTELAPPRRR